jgi:hypothetical protein
MLGRKFLFFSIAQVFPEYYQLNIALLTEYVRPPLWSSDQSSWLQIQRSKFVYRHYQIFWEVVGLERVPLSLVSTIEELVERKNSGSGLENRDYGRRDSPCWLRTIPLSSNAGTNLADKRRLLGRYSSLADWSYRVIKPQNKTLVRNNWQMRLLVFSFMFRPLSLAILRWFLWRKLLKIEVTTRYNGSVESNGI